MASLNVKPNRPVTWGALVWAGIGFALTSYGLYDVSTYSCDATATGGCGDPFGFVLVLWGVPILLLATVFLLGQFAYRTVREDE